MSILYYKNIAESIDKKWDPKADTLFYVVDRKNGGIVAKYKVLIYHECESDKFLILVIHLFVDTPFLLLPSPQCL